MSDLSRSLRRELSGEFPQGNPLVAIGISAQVLDLGMTEDELFDYIIKDVARRLVLRFHTDDGKDFSDRPEVAALRGRIADVYREIQNRDTFNKALSEFRSLKSEERSEIRFLREALETTREKLASYTSKELQITQGSRKLAEAQKSIDRQEAKQNRLIPEYEADIERLTVQGRNAELAKTFYQKHYRAMARYISFLAADESIEGYPNAFDAKWVAVLTLVPGEHASEVPLPVAKMRLTKEFLAAVKPLGIPDHALELLRRRWFRSVRDFSMPIAGEFRGANRLRLHVLALSAGLPRVVFGGWKWMFLGRTVGSVSPLHPEQKFGRYELRYDVSREMVTENIVPFLNLGGLLVSERAKKVLIDPTGKSTLFTKRDTKSLILGVG